MPVPAGPVKSLTLPAKIVVIKWVDIVTDLVWNGGEDAKPLELPVFETVGFLFSKDEEKITICDSVPGIGNRCAFPLGCVLEIKEIGTLEK